MAKGGWGPPLIEASERVQEAVSKVALEGQRGRALGIGASGDVTLLADRAAEDELLKAVGGVGDVGILSEERGTLGPTGARTLAVLDPLDGSSNFERGIPFYCTSVCILEGKTAHDAVFGLVRNLVNGDLYVAEKGKGATKNGAKIRPSTVEEVGKSVVGIDISRATLGLSARLGQLVASAKRQVHFGANALELCLLAEGKIDAFVDLRGKMRITDFAAANLIAREAGAVVTGGEGEDIDPRVDLAEKFSFLAAGNSRLHAKILDLISVRARS